MASSYIQRMETILDKLPPNKTPCSLAECTAGKAFLVLAALGVVFSLVSFSSFVSVIIWEILIGMLIAWMCRKCYNRWIWVAVLIGAAAPLATLIMALAMEMFLSVTSKNSI